MTTKFWLISDRNITEDGLGRDKAKSTSTWVSGAGPLTDIKNWTKVSLPAFKTELLKATAAFPPLEDLARHEEQKHVTVFIHGYNYDWVDAAGRCESICKSLFGGNDSLGVCWWPRTWITTFSRSARPKAGPTETPSRTSPIG
jgi:hypothetical protein